MMPSLIPLLAAAALFAIIVISAGMVLRPKAKLKKKRKVGGREGRREEVI